MVNIRNRRCLDESCARVSSFNAEGCKTPLYCRKHAKEGMVGVKSKRCSHTSCLGTPAWGVLTDGEATVCRRHKGGILGGPVINFKARCRVSTCRKVSGWGLGGKQPTHCRDHGPLEDGLVCSVRWGRSKKSCPSPSYGAAGAPSFHVKPECFF